MTRATVSADGETITVHIPLTFRGVHATLEDLARAEGVHATYVSRVLRLTLLAPDIVEAILDGRQPAELQLDDLLDGFSWIGRSNATALPGKGIHWSELQAPYGSAVYR